VAKLAKTSKELSARITVASAVATKAEEDLTAFVSYVQKREFFNKAYLLGTGGESRVVAYSIDVDLYAEFTNKMGELDSIAGALGSALVEHSGEPFAGSQTVTAGQINDFHCHRQNAFPRRQTESKILN